MMLRHTLVFVVIGLSFGGVADAERFQSPWRVSTPKYIDSRTLEAVDRRYGSRDAKINSTKHIGDMLDPSGIRVDQGVNVGVQGASASRRDEPEARHLEELEDFSVGRAKLHKKYKKYMLPLLLAYKLKFFTLIPLLMGGLVLLAGSTGLAGFFFALFAATMGLKVTGGHR